MVLLIAYRSIGGGLFDRECCPPPAPEGSPHSPAALASAEQNGSVKTAFPLFVLLSLPLAAQDPWDGVRNLAPGSLTQVHRAGASKVKGRLVRADDTEVVLTADRREVRIARSEVDRVRIRTAARRARNAGVGGLIGALAGMATAGIFIASVGDFGTEAVAGMGVLGAGTGAAIGAAIPGYRTVYRR